MQSKLVHTEGRILVLVDREFKNQHTFSFGLTIRHERQWDSFNRRETEPVQGIVISGEDITEGAMILLHHNSATPTNEVYNHNQLSGEEIASDIKIYSIPEEECFAWKEPDGEWQPMKTFDFALRVFKPYEGLIQNIEPTIIKDALYMTTGEYKGLVVRTIKAVDYEIVFREPNTGQESRLIRCRPNGVQHKEERLRREEEVVAIDHGLTQKLKDGQIIIGLSKKDAKPLNEYTYA